MGSKTDGNKCDHLTSKCCKAPVRFFTNGYSVESWCSECGNYIFTGRIEALLALWYGDKEALLKNKGFIPDLSHLAI